MKDLREIAQLAQQVEPYVIDCRRKVHKFAELGGHEVKTSAFIEKQAKKLRLPAEKVSATGLIVTLDTGRPGIGVALRADIDALPLPENPNNLKQRRSVVSDDPQTCHACGHDAHVGMLLGAMQVLCELRDQLSGRIYFCFEEGEENGSGWSGMVEALEKKDVNTVFALHVSSAMEHGLVSVDDGPRMGGMVGVNATFTGRGGHGSRPDLSINPVFAAAAALCNLSVAFVNQIDATETVTLGITSIQGGTTYNVIPDTAQVQGTMRYFNAEEGKKALGILKRVFRDTADMNRCTVDYHPMTNVLATPTINDSDAAALARDAFGKVLPAGALVSTEKWFGSESFSQYLARYKGAFAFLGVRNEDLGCAAEHHNEYFDLDESALVNGVICYAAYAAAAMEDEAVASWGFTPAPDMEFEEEDEEDTAPAAPAESPDPDTAADDAKYSLDTKIGVILKSAQAKKAVAAVVDGVVNHPQIGFAKGITVRKAAKYLPDTLTPEVLAKIQKALASVEE